jgi:replication initiation protein RepC
MTTRLTHSGLPPGISRFDLLRLFEQVARPGYRLSSTAIALIRQYVLKTLDIDFGEGRICAVWTQACRFAEALGLTPRSVNSAERELERARFIVRTAGINGERTGNRKDGVIAWAAGINLAPLIDRFAEIQERAAALQLQACAIGRCRAEIRQIGKCIRDAGDDALVDRAEAILPGGRTARIGSLARLEAIRDALAAVLNAITDRSGVLESSDAPEENCAPDSQNHQLSRIGTRRRRERQRQITPALAVSLATETYRTLIDAMGGPTWPNLIEASSRSCPRLGIAQRTWGRACEQLGRERAALSVLLIDRNTELPTGHRYCVRFPAQCLAGMVRRAVTSRLNLAGLFWACDRGGPEVVTRTPPGAVQQPQDRPSGPLVHLTSRLMAGLARSIGTDGDPGKSGG